MLSLIRSLVSTHRYKSAEQPPDFFKLCRPELFLGTQDRAERWSDVCGIFHSVTDCSMPRRSTASCYRK
jgi:hypothetical protein